MLILYTILITLTFFTLLWIFISFINDSDSFGLSLYSLFLVGIIGWGIIGNVIQVKNDIIEINTINIETIKTSRSIMIINNELSEYYIFDKKSDFDNITDTTTFFYHRQLNMYNGTIGEDILYYTYYDTINKLDTSIICNNITHLGKEI